MKLVVFEDEHVPRLHPISLGRPAYAISCGGFRLLDWLKRLELPIHGLVRPHLAQLQAQDYPELGDGKLDAADDLLLVNARVVPSRAAFHALQELSATGRASVVHHEGEFAACLLRSSDTEAPATWTPAVLSKFLTQAGVQRLPRAECSLPLFTYPHDVIRFNQQILTDNLEYRLATGSYRQLQDGVFLGDNAYLAEHVVVDASAGPIVLEQKARIGPFCYLSGPAYLGHGAKLIEHAAVKDCVSIGHTTKIGGEVEASVIEPYTNKQHHGFLGHSYLGSWINLGAGTCNSDLKNTYGTVNVEYRGEKVATGMQFVGCVLGDYSKTAINTSIFTGKVVGVCSMLYGFVTTNVPSFVNYARLFGQVTELPAEVMVATQKRMFQRRNVEQRPCDIALLHSMYEMTRDERQLAGEPLQL